MSNMDLTIQEKLKLLAGKNGWQLEDLNGKLYEVSVADGPVGVRKTSAPDWGETAVNIKDLPAVAYPSLEVLSQTWNLELAYTMGECLADDCIEKDVDVLLAPGINIKRSPTCGRNFEYPSEDPYLAGVCAGEYIKGVQSKHVGTTLKHYLANNNEVGRLWASSNVDERTLREIYMRAFEIAIKAQPWAVMCSYNLLNGVQVSHDKKSFDILREELGFGDNLIMSDWMAVKDHTASVKAGLDLEMPFNEKHLQELTEDYKNGKITEAEINACVERVLAFIEKVGNESKLRKITCSVEERRSVAQKIEEEGIVLLKNNGVLPIKNGQSVGVTAQMLDRYLAGGGSAKVVPEKKIESVPDCLKTVLSKSNIECAQMWSDEYVESFTTVDGKDVAVILCGFEEGEGNDRNSLKLNNWDNEDWFIKAVAKRNPNTVVVMYGGGVVDVSSWIDDVAALVYVGYAGECGSEAIANVLSGNVNPSGKLTETFAKQQKDYPSENIEFDGLNYNYREGMDVGYRYFDKHPEKIRFPFGYGLSYTKFAYSNLQIKTDGEKTSVLFKITNVGECAGAEVAQVYVRAIDSKVEKPIKELRGFAKTYLEAGATKDMEIVLDDRAFMHYDVNEKAWVKDVGQYEIIVAKHSQDGQGLAKIITIA